MNGHLLLAAMLIATLAPQANAAPGPVGKPLCADLTKVAEQARFKRLGQLPPAEAVRAVFRTDQGCPVKAVPAGDRLGRAWRPR
jgi:hypothetical protein